MDSEGKLYAYSIGHTMHDALLQLWVVAKDLCLLPPPLWLSRVKVMGLFPSVLIDFAAILTSIPVDTFNFSLQEKLADWESQF